MLRGRPPLGAMGSALSMSPQMTGNPSSLERAEENVTLRMRASAFLAARRPSPPSSSALEAQGARGFCEGDVDQARAGASVEEKAGGQLGDQALIRDCELRPFDLAETDGVHHEWPAEECQLNRFCAGPRGPHRSPCQVRLVS